MAKYTRKHERAPAPKGTFIIISPGTDNERKVQLIDISQGGAAFIYQGSREDLDASGILKLLVKDADLEPVNFETVSDQLSVCSQDESLPTRRRGVRFKWMGILREKDLKEFVTNISSEARGFFNRKC